MKYFLKSSTKSNQKNGWSSIFDTGQSTTGKAADSGYTPAKKQASQQANRQVVQNMFQPITFGATNQPTGKAADSGYTVANKQASQQANRQTVQNWWNNEQAKSAQDNATDRAYTAKLTGGANIDNSTEVMESLQRTFGGANDSAETQYNRTLKSKMGYGRNWGNSRSAVGNTIESGVAGTAAGLLNAAGTALKSNRKSGLAVDSGNVSAETTGKEWYNRAGDYLQKDADRAQMLSQNAYLRGSRNLNNAQKLLFDAGIAGTQMASDVALGTLTGGSAMIPMAIRSFGSGAQQARQAGATENQQIAYGTANAFKEALTEKMFDGLGRIYGKSAADNFVDTFAKNFAKSDGGQALARGLINMGGEGLEELAGGFVDPALQGIYNGKTLGENYRELNMDDLLHEGAVGMLLGALGGSVDIAQTGSGQVNSYADAFRKILAEQNGATPSTNADSPDARYKELERKYLEGTLGKEEEDELWRLERMKGQVGISKESADSDREELTPLKIRGNTRINDAIYSPAETVKRESDFWRVRDAEDNKNDEWRAFLKNKEDTATLISKLKSGEISEAIRPQVQRKHIEGTRQFDEYLNLRKERGQTPQSILTVSEQEAQELVKKYSGTGIVVIQKSGENSLKICEFCKADHVVGKWYAENRFLETKRFEIFYSKKGTHIVPVKEIYND